MSLRQDVVLKTKRELNMGKMGQKTQSNIKYLCGGDTVGSS